MSRSTHPLQAWRRRVRRRWKNQPGWWPWLLSLPTRLALGLLRLLPSRLSTFLAERVGRWMWRLPRRRRVGEQHLAQAFPDLDPAERSRIGKTSCGVMARNVAETIFAGPHVTPEDLDGLAVYEDGARDLLRSPLGRGAVFVQGHFGAMEILDGLLGSFGLRLLTVVRLPYNVYVARALTKGREGWGVDLIRRDGALKKLRSRVRDGGSVMLPMDVNAQRGAIFVPWFGRLAATEPAAAWLALRTGRPLIVCYAKRENGEDGTQRVRVGATLVRPESPPEKPKEERLVEVTRSIHAALETIISKYPEQYFWIHDRYRTRPPGEGEEREGNAAQGSPGNR